MIRRTRLRRMFAPAAGLRKPVLWVLGGLVALLLGAALSFKLVLQPAMEGLFDAASRALGSVVPAENLDVATHYLGGGLLLLGLYLLFKGTRGAIRTFVDVINPNLRGGMADVYLRRQQLAQGPRIVALGGGTGLSTLLRGLKQHTSNVTAIVTVTDDGGSSGKLVQDKGMIPPGDIRNCLVALADAEKSMTDLFQHRFQNDSGSLSGHSVGNLLIAALVDQARGDFEKAVEIASNVLAIRGRVLPATLDHVHLRARLQDGREICGETSIVDARGQVQELYVEPRDCRPHPSALEAIADADLVIVGPGSVYTSVLPNLLVPGIAEALQTTSALRVYVCNVMTQRGETEGFSASEHLAAITTLVKERVFDIVLINDGRPSEEAAAKYREVGQSLVEPDADRIRAMGYRCIAADLIGETEVVRHDPVRLASRILSLVDR